MKLLLIIAGVIIVLIGLFSLVSFLLGSPSSPVKPPGFILSRDGARSWIVPDVPEEQKRIVGVDFLDFFFDPTKKSDIVFAGTRGNGIIFSQDLGFRWAPIESQGALKPTSDVFAFAIGSQPPYPIYVAAFQDGYGSVFKSEASQPLFFREVYKVSQESFGIFDLALDSPDSRRVTIATGEGGLLRSTDGGASWQVLHWFPDSVTKLIINPSFFITLLLNGKVMKSVNGGKDWTDITPGVAAGGNFEFFVTAKKVQTIVAHPLKPLTLYLGTSDGFFRSFDAGVSWQPVEIIVPPEQGRSVTAIAVDPSNDARLVISLGRSLYTSEDGGQSWSLVGSIQNGTIGTLRFHPRNPQVVFGGVLR